MPAVYGNFPDEIWSRLKAWAKAQAGAHASPSADECVAKVLEVAEEVTRSAGTLRDDVVTFYANETAEMIGRFREA